MRLYHGFMQPILSMNSARSLDHRLIARYALSESALIDSAAAAVVRLTEDMARGRTLVMAGPGNNGSDGLEVARLLSAKGISTDVFLLTEKGNEENLRRRALLPPSVRITDDPYGYDTVYDALFGFSFHGEADGRTRMAAEAASQAAAVISIDVPSAGLVRADATVSLMALKDVLYEPTMRDKAGRIMLANPGFPPEELVSSPDGMYLLSDDDSPLRPFGISEYKNSRGHVAIIGGSDRYTGAPRLAARAAFAAGAGLVTIITASEKIRDDNPAVIISSGDDFSRFRAIAAGPGWDAGDEKIFREAAASGLPMVIDADALKFVPGRRFSFRAVLTPHIGEYRRLMSMLGIPDGLGNPQTLRESLLRLAAETESIAVLKSSVVWISNGSSIFIYDGCNPSLGVAGSGDVLTGIIGALLAEGYSPRDAAIGGVLLHQRAGKKAHEDYGYYSAEELIIETGRSR